jgi:hypothetical protein
MSSQNYYSNPDLYGSAQYVTLKDIVNNFMIMYVGADKIIDNVDRYTVLFHAKRAVQELNYDSSGNTKSLEVVVDDELKVIMPEDYVNYIRISVEEDGFLFKLSENSTINYAKRYQQSDDGSFLFDIDGNLVEEQSELDKIRIDGSYMMYSDPGYWYGRYGYFYNGDWYFGYRFGGMYGIDTSEANANPKFVVNKESGVINFSSGMAGKLVVIEYISDGLLSPDPSKIKIHKFAEEFTYSYIKWCLVNNRIGINEYVVKRFKDEKSAMLRNAKIRLSGINPRKLLMTLRGRDNWIK